MVSIRLDQISPNPFQPRRSFDDAALEHLASSIRTAGVMQPVVVRPASGGSDRYELVAGERRWRAARLAGLDTVPAIVKSLDDESTAEWALIENLQREDLGPMERAWALRSLAERFGLTHEQVAGRVGLDRSSVTNLVRLTEVEPQIQELLDAGRLTMGHGRALLSMSPGQGRVELARRAADQGWSVRATERAVAELRTGAATGAGDGGGPSSPGGPERPASLTDLERQLGEHLGTKVRLRAAKGWTRGRLVIEFYDLDHFDGLMSKMGFQLRS